MSAGVTGITTVFTTTIPQTLMRLRGRIGAIIDGPTAGDAVCLPCGMIVGTEEQVATGITGFPNPGDDLDAEWVWHGFLVLLAGGTADDQAGGTDRLEIDSKAMRKMKQSQSLVFILTNEALSGTAAVDVALGVRGLTGS